MIDGKFDVVFRGQIVKSFEPETVRANLVALFKSSPEAIERLFTGTETTIRKGLDYSAAMKYQAALRSAGALALIQEVKEEEGSQQQPSSQSQATPKAATRPRDPQPTATKASTPRQSSQATDSAAGDFSLAEAGARILPDKIYEKREVDTSELSLAAVGTRLLPPKTPEKHDKPNIDHLAITDDTTPIGGD